MKTLNDNIVYLVSSHELNNIPMTKDAYKLYRNILRTKDIEEYYSHSAIKVKRNLLLCSEHDILDVYDIKTNKY